MLTVTRMCMLIRGHGPGIGGAGDLTITGATIITDVITAGITMAPAHHRAHHRMVLHRMVDHPREVRLTAVLRHMAAAGRMVRVTNAMSSQ